MSLPVHPDTLTEPDEVADAIFTRVMARPELEDIVRLATVGLAINDLERKAPPEPPAQSAGPAAPGVLERPAGTFVTYGGQRNLNGHVYGPDDFLTLTDEDGHRITLGWVTDPLLTAGHPATVSVIVSDAGVRIPRSQLPRLIAWLGERYSKGVARRADPGE